MECGFDLKQCPAQIQPPSYSSLIIHDHMSIPFNDISLSILYVAHVNEDILCLVYAITCNMTNAQRLPEHEM